MQKDFPLQIGMNWDKYKDEDDKKWGKACTCS